MSNKSVQSWPNKVSNIWITSSSTAAHIWSVGTQECFSIATKSGEKSTTSVRLQKLSLQSDEIPVFGILTIVYPTEVTSESQRAITDAEALCSRVSVLHCYNASEDLLPAGEEEGNKTVQCEFYITSLFRPLESNVTQGKATLRIEIYESMKYIFFNCIILLIKIFYLNAF